ncbi:MAG: alpha/beta hydrolase [marine benthic group bacterium]|nr:alpha/beta hydrolase [Gemmatimonadota bacterium]
MILRRLAVLAVVACGSPGQASVQAQSVPRFEPVDRSEFPVAVPASRRATVGYLVVWEDRSTRSATIRFPVAVVHAPEPSELEPVLLITGGPGSGSLTPAAYPGAYPWTAERDFVVFGQRGTQHAQPALECPELEKAFGDVLNREDRDARYEILGAAARTCRERLRGSGVDLSAYHTDAITEDVDDLASVLGISRLILFGLSYGTRVALDLARDFPERVAAMVLDSPLPPDVQYDDESAVNFRNALEAVASACSEDTACDAAYPDLRNRFFAGLDAAEAAPVAVRLQDSGHVLQLDGARLASLIDLGSPGGLRLAPQRMAIIAEGDPELLRPLLPQSYSGSGFAWGMRASVWCAEAWPFSERAEASGPGPTLGGYESAAVSPPICREWGVPRRPGEFTRPVSTDIPTLLIAGEFDPATPPEWAHRAATSLSNSRVLVISGATHTPSVQWDGDGCAMSVATDFVAHPERWLADSDVPACMINRSDVEFEVEAASAQ